MKNGERAARLTKFLASLKERGLDGVVLDRREDYFYFTGYTGSDAVAVFSVKSGKGWLITDSRYTEEAEKTAPGMETLLWKGGFAAFTGKLLKKLRCKKVGHTPNSMTAAFFANMKAEAPGVGDWSDVEQAVMELRSVKSKAEVDLIRAALDCRQKAYLAAKKRWKPGMTEMEVKNDLEWEMRKCGAEDTSFETIVAVGANASLSHAHAGQRKIQPGKMLLVDFGAKMNRYCADLTRTAWCESIPAVWKKRYKAVLEAQQAGMAAVRAGVPGVEAHKAAVAVFAKYGLADKFIHGLGHAIGLVVHENPRLSALWTKPLQAGNIVTVEPGVYFPGSGGIRTEDMVLVTKDGCEVLSSLPRDLDSAVF